MEEDDLTLNTEKQIRQFKMKHVEHPLVSTSKTILERLSCFEIKYM